MSGNTTSIVSRIGLACAGVLVLVGLTGCVEDEVGPQFANNPPTATSGPGPGLPTAAPATPEAIATPVAHATPVTVEDLLRTRGAVQRIFLASGQTIWAVNDSGESATIFEAEPDEQVLAIGPSPDVTQVAAILAWDNGRESSLLILDADGGLVEEVDLPGEPTATPVSASTGSGNAAVNWSPQGDKILMLAANGEVLATGVEEGFALEPVELGQADGAILEPVWSPTGQQIAFLRVNPETRSRALFVHDLASGETTELVGSADGRIVVEFAWEPGGQEILFTEGSALNSATTGIDLWRIRANGSGRELVAPAGATAPVARITTVTPSPDGKSVAYAVLVPGQGAPSVDSVWVRNLTTGQGIRFGLPSVRSVENMWWTSEGLAIATVADRRGSPVLAVLLVAPSGNVSALWVEPMRAASPGPVASPVALDGDQVEAASP